MSEPSSPSPELFERAFGRAPHRCARAPGRVNLIGEHVDYNDLPVLPMALQRAVRIDFAPRDDARVRLSNADPRFAPRELELSAAIAPSPQGDWSNYVRAAGQALVERSGPLRGVDALVSSDLPAAAGLSSSSALVVASALALLDANALSLERLELAELCARAERYVGTSSGGMDQATSLLARRGHALRIEFAPLRVEPLPLPSDWRFVVASSLVVADKSGSARASYNARRDACRDALRRLAASPVLQDAPRSYPELLARHSTEELLELAAIALEPDLLPRFRHVVTEARRVEAARAALLAGDAEAFGRAMDASHASLRDDCEVSCAELDALVEFARRSGALGARLTGAGFGGAIVALCRERDLAGVLEGLEQAFFGPRGVAGERSGALFVAEASDGASLGPAD